MRETQAQREAKIGSLAVDRMMNRLGTPEMKFLTDAKGDVTKIPNWDSLVTVIQRGQSSGGVLKKPLGEALEVAAFLEKEKRGFKTSFKEDDFFGRLMFYSGALSVLAAAETVAISCSLLSSGEDLSSDMSKARSVKPHAGWVPFVEAFNSIKNSTAVKVVRRNSAKTKKKFETSLLKILGLFLIVVASRFVLLPFIVAAQAVIYFYLATRLFISVRFETVANYLELSSGNSSPARRQRQIELASKFRETAKRIEIENRSTQIETDRKVVTVQAEIEDESRRINLPPDDTEQTNDSGSKEPRRQSPSPETGGALI
jgi:hypothetical protein